jgi:hypothetical protein
MGRKWIRTKEWVRQPHVKDGPPSSLWWYQQPYRNQVIKAYLERAARGRALPDEFSEELKTWLSELSQPQNMKAWDRPRTVRYWSVPAYAAYLDTIKPATLMKYLRELENVAKKLFPADVPSSRKSRKLNAEEIQELKRRYLAGTDAKVLAEKFRITPARVGQLCGAEKKQRAADRARLSEQPETNTNASPMEALQNPFELEKPSE